MRTLVVLVAAAVALAAPLTAVATPAPAAPQLPPPDALARLDPDGGRTLMLTIDDGEGGTWRNFPVSDAGVAEFTHALRSQNVKADPLLYGAEVREMGVFLHAWTLEGTPYITLGTYVRTDALGLLRLPVVIVENVSDLAGAAAFAGSLVADDALPMAAEMVPHVYGIAAPDLFIVGVLGSLAPLLLGTLAHTLVLYVRSADGGTELANLPPEVYPPLEHISLSVAQMGMPLLLGQFGVGGGYDDSALLAPHNLTYDWIDRPEVRVWTARKVAAGHDVWAGASISRTGAHEGDGVGDFRAWKRLAVGPATRVDGVVTTPAAMYVRADVSRHYEDDVDGGASRIENHYTLSAGLAAAGADTPLVVVQMDEWREDDGDEGSTSWMTSDTWNTKFGIEDGDATYLPAEQEARWSVGTGVGGSFTPLVGARTQTWHRGHADETNLGEPIFEWESERLTSAGVYVLGEYVPLVGARTWIERFPVELYALILALDGWGSQMAGDFEASVGTFVLGQYTPLAGTRYDDDFPYHLHAYRGMVSAGSYLNGAYQPLVATTYDGETTLNAWVLSSEGPDHRWQTSAGTFTLGFYRPVFGMRYEPETQSGRGAEQESYQVGIYPLHYDPFIPIASIDYDGAQPSVEWAVGVALTGGVGGSPATLDAVAYTPGPYAFPVAGVRYLRDAPDMSNAVETHLVVGVYTPQGAFVPVAGASYGSTAHVVGLGASLAQQALGGPRHADASVTLGVYGLDGEYAPLVTVDTRLSPV